MNLFIGMVLKRKYGTPHYAIVAKHEEYSDYHLLLSGQLSFGWKIENDCGEGDVKGLAVYSDYKVHTPDGQVEDLATGWWYSQEEIEDMYDEVTDMDEICKYFKLSPDATRMLSDLYGERKQCTVTTPKTNMNFRSAMEYAEVIKERIDSIRSIITLLEDNGVVCSVDVDHVAVRVDNRTYTINFEFQEGTYRMKEYYRLSVHKVTILKKDPEAWVLKIINKDGTEDIQSVSEDAATIMLQTCEWQEKNLD